MAFHCPLPAGRVLWKTRILVRVLPWICCVALAKSLHHSGPEKGMLAHSASLLDPAGGQEAPAD